MLRRRWLRDRSSSSATLCVRSPLGAETTVPLAWIADHLVMGSTSTVTRASIAIGERLKKDRALRRAKKDILARIVSLFLSLTPGASFFLDHCSETGSPACSSRASSPGNSRIEIRVEPLIAVWLNTVERKNSRRVGATCRYVLKPLLSIDSGTLMPYRFLQKWSSLGTVG